MMFLASLLSGGLLSAAIAACWVGLSHLSLPVSPELWAELKGVFWPVAPFAVALSAWIKHEGLTVSFSRKARPTRPQAGPPQ